ncbi:MAG: phosphohydrolase [Desulfuromonas sp.]|uniref:HD domain-containing protein n=1 Tax=Desulfuromonas sp. TaxID=892 RepID=UPI000CBD8354|nr:HD domain-containing protein [Desulfuromonas sp.]PLX85704.1 MAG: phosphohydrolase [Desulfuromonas sp.]
MNPLQLIAKYHPPGSARYRILVDHSTRVARKAVTVAKHIGLADAEVRFVEEAALLHDIGIHFTDAPELGCRGDLPYLAHGYMGRELLESEGLPRHALVCDRHIGVGLSPEDIYRQGLPLPHRDLRPVSREEQIVAYADLFFSKHPDRSHRERSPDQVRSSLARFGPDKVAVFELWHAGFRPG